MIGFSGPTATAAHCSLRSREGKGRTAIVRDGEIKPLRLPVVELN